MRILFCNWKDLAHPRAGGAEVWTHGIASAWTAAGHDVTLACSAAPGLAPRDERDGVHIERGGDYRFGVHGHVRRVYERERGQFDLVVDEINTRPFAAPRWARSSRVIAWAHQVAREVWFSETSPLVAPIGRFLLEPRWLRGYRDVPFFTASVSAAESLRDYGIDDAVVLPQGSDLPPVPTSPPAKAPVPTFVFVGRLCAMKRPLDAVRAFTSVQRRVPDAQLWIIGRGPQEEKVRRAAARLDGVQFLGHVSRAERDARLAQADALVATSVREGWGLVVSEAAAVGTGTIAYAIPGLVDSVRATGGTLVTPRVDALTCAMTAVAAQRSRAPRPVATGTVPFSEVAERLLAAAEVGADA